MRKEGIAMSKNRFLLNEAVAIALVALLLLSTLGALFLPIIPATATSSAAITLSPNKGKVKTKFQIVGTGFNPDTSVTITFGGKDITPTGLKTNSTGGFTAICEVPFVPTGTYTVQASDGTNSATQSFTVVRGITLIPSKGPVGTKVEIYGSGFTGGRDVNVYFDKNGNGIYESGEIWASTTVKSDGTFNFTKDTTDNRKVVPSVTAGYGDYRVYASDGVVSDTVYFTVARPTIVISPDKGKAGTEITVNINYFTLGHDVQVFLDVNNNGVPDDNDVIIQIKASDLNNTGGASNLKITVPEGIGYGTYNVIAKNDVGDVASKTFTVMRPVIAIINPATKKGVAGTTITVQVNYFNKTVGAGTTFVFFDANKNNKYDTGEMKVDLSLNNTGGDQVTLTVPTVPYGTYPVNATNNIQSAVDYFTVERPVIVISKYPVGVPGTPVEVSINYFSLGVPVNIGYDVNKNGKLDAGEVVTTVSSLNSTGGAKVVASAHPALGYGTYTINATNGVQWAATTFTVMHPTIKLSRDKGTAGTPLTVDINYFNKTSGAGDVRIGFDVNKNGKLDAGEVLRTVAVGSLNETGGTSGVLISVPASVGFGPYNINATNNVQSVVAAFTVMEPIIVISPNKGTAGTTIDVYVNYYNKTVSETYVFFDANRNGKLDGTETKVTLSLNDTGGAHTTLPVPNRVGYFVYNVYANNSLGQVRYASFTVMEPVMTINPTSGGEGTTVTVTINYFNKTVSTYVFFDTNGNGRYDAGEPRSPPTGGLSLDNTGGNVSTIQVPFGIGTGVYRIYAVNDYQSKYCEFTVVAPEQAIEEKLDNIVIPGLNEIKAMLKNEDYGLAALRLAINSLSSRVEEIAGAIMDKLSAIESKLGTFTGTDTVASLLYNIGGGVKDIKAKTDTIVWNDVIAIKDIVTTNLDAKISSVLAAIDSAKSEIASAISGLDKKLGAFTGTDTVASLLYDIKGAVSSIEDSLVGVELNVGEILTKLDSETYGLAAIKNAISDLSRSLGTFTGTDTVASLLYDIRSKLEGLTAAQAASGSGSRSFTSSGTVIIYQGSKVGTVTVSIKTAGVYSGEYLIVRYYIDPNNPNIYIEKTVASGIDVRGWTDTAAAWKVELAYTWKSGTDVVYWSYSAIYPP